MTDALSPLGVAAAAPRVAGSTRLQLIGVASLLVILTNALTFLLPPLLPVIQAEYQITSVAAATWIFTLLTLGGGAGFIVLPKLSDVAGDRTAAVAACIAMTLGGGIIAVGNSYGALLAGAVVMGFGGAAQLLPLGFLRRALGESGLAISVAVLVMATGAGIVIGMIGGGLIVDYVSVQMFFYILTACFAVTIFASALIIPQNAQSISGGSIPVIGTTWLVAWIGALLLAMTQGLEWGAGALIPLVVGIVGAATWLQAQRKTSTPVFDPSVAKSSPVILSCIVITLIAMVNAAFLVLMSNFAQVDPAWLAPSDSYGLGLSALDTGMLMIPFAVTFLIGGAVAERPVAAGRGLAVFNVGAVIALAGFVLLIAVSDQEWSFLVASGVVGFGCSIVYSACFALVQQSVREEKAGMAGAMVGTAMAVGFSLGSAVVTTVLSWSTLVIPGTDIEIASKGQFGIGYWIVVGIAALIVVAVASSRSRVVMPSVADRV
ncbi:MFS transporter [Gordonia sp. PDNC005]|uniref:MFS transporter n=1 Tax=unclassified Gordonia (in: high G+C Gram-positive bacteria) TaxID=2657482 RepID=UPI001964C8A1|nr:MFS transporter [Gordonia sp. PDNC005]QRY62140.1 MFS transporter [Gordonia sp. PDNC005]